MEAKAGKVATGRATHSPAIRAKAAAGAVVVGGRGPQTLVIAKDGDSYKVTHKTQRGDKTYDATVSGNAISWTEERPNRDGGTMKIQFKATIDGDALKGTFGGGQFSREFTAKRST